MSDTELLMREIETLPQNYVAVVLDLVASLKSRGLAENEASTKAAQEYIEWHPKSIEEAHKMAQAKAAYYRNHPDEDRYDKGPALACFGETIEDYVAYQRSIRDEWGDPWEESGNGVSNG
jgi:hypothetical protein